MFWLFVIANFKQTWHKQVEIESSAIEKEYEPLPKQKKRSKSSSESDFDGIISTFNQKYF